MADVTRRPPRAAVVAAVALVAGLVVSAAVLALMKVFDRSPFTGTLSSGSASCPQTSEQPTEAGPQRVGQPLLPADPTVAFLCIYLSEPNELARTYTLTSDAAVLVEFLNERPETAEVACLDGGDEAARPTAGFLVVVGYAEGFAVVRPAGCGGLESMGAVRYDAGRDLFAFWGVTPQTAWPRDAVS